MGTILLIGEARTGRTELANLLRPDHRVLQATDGPPGLAAARMAQPDLIVVDWLLPTTDGGAFVARLRAEPATAAIPVLLLAPQYHEPAAASLARQCGARGCLTRPLDPGATRRMVLAALDIPTPTRAAEAASQGRGPALPVADNLRAQGDRLRRENDRLAALLQLAAALGPEADPQLLAERLAHQARALIGARFAAVVIPADALDRPPIFAGSGMEDQRRAQFQCPPAGPLPSRAAATPNGGPAWRGSNPGGDPAALGLDPAAPQVSAILAVPMALAGPMPGCLCLWDKVGADAFTAEDEQLAQFMAAQAGRAYTISQRLSQAATSLAEALRERDALRQSEGQWRAIVEANPQAVAVVQADVVRYANRAAAALFGYAGPEEMIGREWPPLVAAEDRPALRARFDACLRGAAVGRHASWRGVRRDGDGVDVDSDDRPLSWQGAPAVLTFPADAGPRQRLEAQLLQAQKMELVGRLAAGVAHDFNNLLTVILGCCDLALVEQPAGPVAELLREARRAGDRAGQLTRQMLVLSRKRPGPAGSADPAAVLGETAKVLGRLLGEDVALRVSCPPSLGLVRLDAGQIEQVLLNLAINARDAMPRGGQLVIEAANVTLPAGEAAGAPPRPYVLLAVSDTGIGMDAATRARAFEPFFSTKAPDKGSGLGLAIVRQCGGHVEVESEPEVGSIFRVFLPREVLAGASAVPAGPPRPRGGSETVLLVEDDPAMRSLARLALRGRGYTLLEARDAAEAVAVSTRHTGPIHLLVAGAALPDVGGRPLAEHLRLRRPGLRVLTLTDPAAEPPAGRGGGAPAAHAPRLFTPEALARQVRDVLDSA